MQRGYVSEIFTSFQGEGLFAGRRHLFLRMAGCNLRCGYCDTPGSLERTPHCMVEDEDGSQERLDNPLDVAVVAERLSRVFRDRVGVHALAVTGGEPLLQADFLAALLETARPPVPVLLETNGTYPERLARVLPHVTIVSMDVKLPSNSGEAATWDEHRAFLEAGRGRTLYVKVPVDESTLDDEVDRAARLVGGVGREIPLYLQPIVSPDAELEITASRLERFYDIAVRHLDDVRVLPQMHKILGVR